MPEMLPEVKSSGLNAQNLAAPSAVKTIGGGIAQDIHQLRLKLINPLLHNKAVQPLVRTPLVQNTIMSVPVKIAETSFQGVLLDGRSLKQNNEKSGRQSAEKPNKRAPEPIASSDARALNPLMDAPTHYLVAKDGRVNADLLPSMAQKSQQEFSKALAALPIEERFHRPSMAAFFSHTQGLSLQYRARHLPGGLQLDPQTGLLSGLPYYGEATRADARCEIAIISATDMHGDAAHFALHIHMGLLAHEGGGGFIDALGAHTHVFEGQLESAHPDMGATQAATKQGEISQVMSHGLTYQLLSKPIYGDVTLFENGAFTYVLRGDLSATGDFFRYQSMDEEGAVHYGLVYMAPEPKFTTPYAGWIDFSDAQGG